MGLLQYVMTNRRRCPLSLRALFAILVLAVLAQYPVLAWSQINRLVVLGSSTAAGTGSSHVAKSWVGQLEVWLESRGTFVVNLAVPGALTASAACIVKGKPNWRKQINPQRNVERAIALGATHLILAFPSNDAIAGVPVTQTRDQLLGIRRCAARAGIKVAIMSTQPRAGVTPEQAQAIEEVDALMRRSFGKCYIDVNHILLKSGGQSDGSPIAAGDKVHYNDRGHAIIFGTVQKFIESGSCF